MCDRCAKRFTRRSDLVTHQGQDEAVAPYSVSREVPRSVLKCETVLAPMMSPQKFQDTLHFIVAIVLWTKQH